MTGMKKHIRGITVIVVLFALSIAAIVVCVGIGTIEFTPREIIRAIFTDDGSPSRLIVWNLRLPRILTGGLVGICLALSGCVLQGVMRNNLASPSTIGVTGGASFVGYLTLVAFPAYSYLLPVGSIAGAFVTTMLIYALAYQKGVSPVRMILSGMAVSALFGAFNDMIKTFFADSLGNASGFLVGGLNGTGWSHFGMITPYALCGVLLCFLLPSKMNILMLGDETANSLGLRTERFRFFLIAISSLLSGAAISVAGLISLWVLWCRISRGCWLGRIINICFRPRPSWALRWWWPAIRLAASSCRRARFLSASSCPLSARRSSCICCARARREARGNVLWL